MSRKALPEGHIRLLKLQGFGKRERKRDIRPAFSRHTFSRDSAPPYHALSYVWGVDPATYRIWIDEEPVFVRHNLFNFCLYMTRRCCGQSQPDTEIFIWVDALCVDQSNVTERNHQVAVMNTIYANAARVTVWLGTIIPPNAKQQGVHPEPLKWKPALQRRGSRIDSNGFTESTYWSRRWTIQEFMLASQIDFFWCNDSGESVTLTDDELLAAYDRRLKPSIKFGRGGAYAYLEELYGKRNSSSKVTENKFCLLDMLLEFDSCQCNDPRDRVFALLGLIDSNERQTFNKFFPDYSLPHESVVVMTLGTLQYLNGSPILGQRTPDGFQNAEVMSKKYSQHHDSWCLALLKALGVDCTTHEDAMQWQEAADQFEFHLHLAQGEVWKHGEYPIPRLTQQISKEISP